MSIAADMISWDNWENKSQMKRIFVVVAAMAAAAGAVIATNLTNTATSGAIITGGVTLSILLIAVAFLYLWQRRVGAISRPN